MHFNIEVICTILTKILHFSLKVGFLPLVPPLQHILSPGVKFCVGATKCAVNVGTIYIVINKYKQIVNVGTICGRRNYHHSMFHNPTAAVNLFHVGKQYLTLCKAEAAVTRNLIGRKIISNVKHADARYSLPILDVIRSSDKRHSTSEYCK